MWIVELLDLDFRSNYSGIGLYDDVIEFLHSFNLIYKL